MKWHREPLFHFLALGVGFFLLYGAVAAPVREADVIDVTAGDVEQLVRVFEKTWQRPPTEAELDNLIEERIKEEVFYQQALAMGLDRDDTIVRRRLRQKMEFLSEDVAALSEPTESDLAGYLQKHADAFRRPPRFSFRHVYLNPDRRGEAVFSEAEQLLRALGEAADALALGDPFLLPRAYESLPAGEVAKLFGSDFAVRLEELPPGRWVGPVKSGFGLHLVRVSERWEGELPELAEVRDAVERDWTAERRAKSAEAFYAALRQRYTVSVERGKSAPKVAEVR
jgi:hypothetical protein